MRLLLVQSEFMYAHNFRFSKHKICPAASGRDFVAIVLPTGQYFDEMTTVIWALLCGVELANSRGIVHVLGSFKVSLLLFAQRFSYQPRMAGIELNHRMLDGMFP